MSQVQLVGPHVQHPRRLGPPSAGQEVRPLPGLPEHWLRVRRVFRADGLGLAAVVAHFAGQLEGAGWTLSRAERDGALRWSTWGFRWRDEPFLALFTVLQEPWESGQYVLDIEARYDGEDARLRARVRTMQHDLDKQYRGRIVHGHVA